MHRIIFFFIYLFSLLPLRVHYFLSDILAWLLHHVVHYRYSTIVTNLARSFPELSYKEIKDITGKFYKNFADVAVESVWAISASSKAIGRQVRVSGQEALNHALDLNRNVIIMLGHLGNWEIFTGLPDLRTNYGINLDNKDLVFVYKRPRGKMTEKILDHIRTRHGSCSTVEAHNILRNILKNTDGKQAYFFICDQRPGKERSRFNIRFLNQDTLMIEGPESIAARLGMPVLYCSILRHGRRDNEAHFELITENASECSEGYVTATFASMLEKDITEHKETWLWSHKRWKKKS